MKVGTFAVLLKDLPWSMSIEHEDSLMPAREDLARAARPLREAVIGERAGAMW